MAFDLTKRVPPRNLLLRLKRLRDRIYSLRLKIDNEGYYNDIVGHLSSAECDIYQAELGNIWRNEFHIRGKGSPKDSPYVRK